mmetsp:Transcript_46731/g.97778  ORF Transcript_46731/g.97778 Transcript_46731/m.97778 type:complete len:303 (-) Transcript_46731:80-988(-)
MARDRRHCRSRQGRLAGRRSRQRLPLPHPERGRDHARDAGLRRQRHHPRRGPCRPRRRHRHHHLGAPHQGSGGGGGEARGAQPRPHPLLLHAGGAEGVGERGGDVREDHRVAQRRQGGAAGHRAGRLRLLDHQGRAVHQRVLPPHGEARLLPRQPQRGGLQAQEEPLPQAHPRLGPVPRRRHHHPVLGGVRVEAAGDGLARRGRGVLQGERDDERPAQDHQDGLHDGAPHLLLHRRARRGARVGDSQGVQGAPGRGGHPHRLREGLHLRRGDGVQRPQGAGHGGGGAGQGQVPPGGQALPGP